MQQLTDRELYLAIEYARSIDENTGRSIIETFQKDQPALAHSLFTIFPSMFTEKDQAFAHLFLDLCFDVICIYQHAFGDMPAQDNAWLQKQSSLVNTELQALMPDNKINTKKIKQLQQDFTKQTDNKVSQPGLVKFMNDSINQYASEIASDASSIKLTQNMIFTVIRLFGTVYSQAD